MYIHRDFYSRQVFEERDVLLPHTGEVVAVHSEEDGYWYRARVLDSNDDSLSVRQFGEEVLIDKRPVCFAGVFCGLWQCWQYFGCECTLSEAKIHGHSISSCGMFLS